MLGVRRDLPSGTVTFLFTDVEGSTKLLHEMGRDRYAEALAQHGTGSSCRLSAKVRQPRTADMDADDLYLAVWPDGQPVSTITSNGPM